MTRTGCVSLFLVLSISGAVFGRTWTDVDGKTIDAELVKFDYKAREVTLKPKTGRPVTVPMGRLTFDDQAYVHRQQGPGLTKALPPAPPAPKMTPDEATERITSLKAEIRHQDGDKTKPLNTLSIGGLATDVDAVLEAARARGGIRTLSLHAPTNLSPTGIAHIGEMSDIEEVKLYYALAINDGFARYLTKLPRLKSLIASEQRSFTPKIVSMLAEAKELETLSLERISLSAADLAPLKKLKKIKALILSSCDIDDAGMRVLCELTTLKSLVISRSRITDDAISGLKNLPELFELGLRDSRATDKSLSTIAALPKLAYLYFTGNDITDAGAVLLKGKTTLVKVDFQQTQVTEAVRAELQRSLKFRDRTVSASPKSTEEPTIFDVILSSYRDSAKAEVIKVVHAATGYGLSEATQLVEAKPRAIRTDVPKADAERLKKDLEKAGATVELR